MTLHHRVTLDELRRLVVADLDRIPFEHPGFFEMHEIARQLGQTPSSGVARKLLVEWQDLRRALPRRVRGPVRLISKSMVRHPRRAYQLVPSRRPRR